MNHQNPLVLWRAALVLCVAMAAGALAGPAVYATATLGAARTSAALAATSYDWPQFGGDPAHSGNNTREQVIGLANANSLTRAFQVTLPDVADGAPAYLSGVTINGATHDALFLTTKAGYILALDAHTGAQLWAHQNGPGACKINNGATPCYTTSSPAVDPGRQYVYSYGLDGYVHKYQVSDGAEITGGGWPEQTTIKPWDEKGSSALSIATASNGVSYLYVTNGGYPGDRGDYQGHVTAINLNDNTQRVFNANCSDQTIHLGTGICPAVQSAIWARAGVVYDAANDRIYAATGNGAYNPAAHDWGDSVLALHPDGSGSGGQPVDTYTPANYQHLDNADLDLGSTAPAILPAPAGSSVAHLGLQSGKDGVLRLLNLDNLSGQGGPGHTGGEVQASLTMPGAGQVLTTPAVLPDFSGSTWAFVSNAGNVVGLRVTLDQGGAPGLQMVWNNAGGATSPVIANRVLYYARSGSIHAVDPSTGHEVWSNSTIGGIHWESPIVANGMLYITDESAHLTAFAPARQIQAVYLPYTFR